MSVNIPVETLPSDGSGKRPLAVVVASGGMDSCVTAAVAGQFFDLALFHLNYEQRTWKRELEAFKAQAEYFGAQKTLVVDAAHFSQIGGSSLTDHSMKVPVEEADKKIIPSTYVPFRNANILSMAVSWAEVIGATRIFIGAVEEDSSGYPDCTEAFIEAFNNAVREGTRPDSRIQILAPLIHMSKGEIVMRGTELSAPLHLSWSCYLNENEACGKCDSCRLRLNGFKMAGIPDPIRYKAGL